MSCLTKKSLFFLVLAIVCNTTFSDTYSECVGSIHEVFEEGVEPWDYFEFATSSLSEGLITSMINAQDYKNFYVDNKHVIDQLCGKTPIVRIHNKTISYVDSLLNTLQSSSITAHYNIPVETRQQYVLGYFQSLIVGNNNFKNVIRHKVHTPQHYCGLAEIAGMAYLLFGVADGPSINEMCLETIYKMLDLNDLRQNMDKYDIFVHLYKKYHYLDFSAANYFPLYIENEVDVDEYEIEDRLQLSLMALYLDHIADVAIYIANQCKANGIQIFPTIHNYCSGGSSS